MLADSLGQTLALLATFVGIGILVNVLVIYDAFAGPAFVMSNAETEPAPERMAA